VKVKWVLKKQAAQKIAYRSVPVEGYCITVLSYWVIPFRCKTYWRWQYSHCRNVVYIIQNKTEPCNGHWSMYIQCYVPSIFINVTKSVFYVTLRPDSGLGRLVLGFLNHTQLHTHTHTHGRNPWTSDQPVAEGPTNTTHNKHIRRRSMPPVGFEPAIPAMKRAADLRLSPHGHRDRLMNINTLRLLDISTTWLLWRVSLHTKKVQQSLYMTGQALQGSRRLRFPEFLYSRHTNVARLSAYYVPAAFTPQEMSLILSSVRSSGESRSIVRPEGFSQWIIRMTPSAVEPAALRHVAVCSKTHTKHTNALNVCRT
jgi:hypothetical protein